MLFRSITQYAAEDLDDTEEIGPDRPDSDWITRFFRIAEDITTDEMQALWGKVLAGEVKRVGSFSLRTLDILKNISTKEAELFARVAHLGIINSGITFLLNPDQGKFLEESFGINMSDQLILKEIGLLSPSKDLGLRVSTNGKDITNVYTCGSTCLSVFMPASTPTQVLPGEIFTQAGNQLHQLVEHEPANRKYVEKFSSTHKGAGVVVKYAQIVHRNDDGSFGHTPLQDIISNS